MKTLLFAALAVFLQQNNNPLQQQRPAQGSIEGTVTRQGSGQPVIGARVTVTRRGGPAQPALPAGAQLQVPVAVNAGARGGGAQIQPVMTDDKGKYVVPGLEDGAYTIQIQANGYVAQPYGQRFANGPAAPVNVANGQPTRDINVSITPASNVSGHVRDTSDRPLINVPVQLLRSSYDGSGQRSYVSAGTTITNDRGEYRIYWVTPGRYYLLVGKPSTGSNAFESLIAVDTTGPNGNEVPSVLGYAFYPGVTEIASARAIDLQPGADVQSIDLTLVTKPRTFSVRGKVIDGRTGKPPARASVFVATQTPGLSGAGIDELFGVDGATQNYNAKTGTMEIHELLPGTYSVVGVVQDPPVAGRPGPQSQAMGMLAVNIANSDVDGLTLTITPALSVPGRIRIDGQLPSGMTLDRLRIRLVPTGANAQQSLSGLMSAAFYGNSMANVAADGTFRFNNIVPGDYRIEINSAAPTAPATGPTSFLSLASGSFLKDVRIDGTDGLNNPLRVPSTVSNGLDIVLGIGGGKLTGAVTDLRNQPVAGARVVLVPDRGRHRSELFKTATTDPSGVFTFSSVPPGDYKVFAWETIETNAWFDPEILTRYDSRSHGVHVSETSAENIDVRIIPAEASR